MRQDTVKRHGQKRTVEERVRAVMSLVEANNSSSLGEFKRYLADRSPTVRATALDVVGKEKARDLEDQVLLLLSDKNHFVQYSAVECLGSLHAGEPVRARWLYPLLRDPHPLVRIETIESLGRIGDKEALPLVAEGLEDNDPLVRSYAAALIADLDGERFLPLLQRKSMEETEDVARVGIAYALFQLGEAEQLSVLLNLLSSGDYHVRCSSANSLKDAALSPAQRQSVLEALSYAASHALAVADRSTMEQVAKELREQE